MPPVMPQLALALALCGDVAMSAQLMKKNKPVIMWNQGAALPKGGYASGVVGERLILAGGTY